MRTRKVKKTMASRKRAASITGLQMRTSGDLVEVLVEIDNQWRLVGSDHYDAEFIHLWTASDLERAPLDPVTTVKKLGFPQNAPKGRQ